MNQYNDWYKIWLWKKICKKKLDKNLRFIYYDSNFDVTIIEILQSDKIKEKFFLFPNKNKISNIDQKIYILQYPGGEKLSYSEGKIKKINDFEIIYNASTKEGSSGSPIFLKKSTEVIVIHKKGNRYRKENYGTLISSIIQTLQSQKEEILINKFLDNNYKEFYANGDYYIGESLNGKKHGKGILYYENGKIKYGGEFVNGKMEGKGKLIF